MSSSCFELSAARLGEAKVLEVLLKLGASSHAKTANGSTIVHVAAENWHANVIPVCRNLGAPVDERNDEATRPIHYECVSVSIDLVVALQKALADLNAPDMNQNISLHYAVKYRHDEIADFLAEHEVAPDADSISSPEAAGVCFAWIAPCCLDFRIPGVPSQSDGNLMASLCEHFDFL
jgi:ankyrin repeat protein